MVGENKGVEAEAAASASASLSRNISDDGWFSESEVLWPGQKFSIKVKDEGVLERVRSDFQDILVFDSETYGKSSRAHFF